MNACEIVMESEIDTDDEARAFAFATLAADAGAENVETVEARDCGLYTVIRFVASRTDIDAIMRHQRRTANAARLANV